MCSSDEVQEWEVRQVVGYELKGKNAIRPVGIFPSIEAALDWTHDIEDEDDEEPPVKKYTIYNKHDKVSEERIIY